MKTAIPTESQLKRMTPEQRAQFGKAGRTIAEISATQEIKGEKELQKHMTNLLRQRGWLFLNPPMHKPSAFPKGWPDYTIFPPNKPVLFAEAKVLKGQLSDDQSKLHSVIYLCTGQIVHVVRTITEFKEILDKIL